MKKILFFSFILLSFSCNQSEKTMNTNSHMFKVVNDFSIPVPEKEAKSLEIHGDVRVDNYYWMKLSDEQKLAKTPDQQTQKVLDYLNSENQYKNQMTAHLDQFQDKLFDEIVGRIKQTDMSVPYKYHGYHYITRYEEGKEYPIYSRKKESLEAEEEIMLDVNEMAKDFDYFNVAGRAVSPNNQILAYGEDTLSRRIYTLKFKNLETGELLSDQIPNCTGGATWANDNKTLFYTRKDEALRAYKIFRHTLGTPASEDVEIYHEKDETFGTYVYKTKSEKYLVIGCYSTLSSEYRILDANNPTGQFEIFQPREKKLEYGIAHFEDKWFIRTNKDEAQNFKIMTCPDGQTNKSNWVDFETHRKDVLVQGMSIFKNHLAISERVNGVSKVRIRPWEGESHYIDFGENSYSSYMSANPEIDTDIVRVGFTSLTTPNTTYDYDTDKRALKLLKQQEVIGDFKASDYQSERIFATAGDGTKIPISIVYKKGFKKDGSQPVLLYGYGSYGASMDPYFSSVRLTLLNRGFAFAIAHIRGGEDMGRQWYEDGKLLKKRNTFTDFIDCGKHLVSNKYAAEDKLFAMGGSAGGLLMGAVMNMAPDLWKGVIAAVPFVDVVTTMLDESIPLTTGEFDEWGNPKNKEYYEYMKSYSPYDNVESKNYPATLVTTGYHDSQVQYWEPAKWVAKLRELKTDDNPLLMHCEMEAGHGGKSGRFQRYKETALEYAFLLDLAGRSETNFQN